MTSIDESTSGVKLGKIGGVKQEITEFCKLHGADLVGYTSVDRWAEYGDVPEAFYPQAIWPMAKTVIVLGMQLPLPIVDSTPSSLHKETYDTTNRQLDDLALRLVRHLNGRGMASIFFSRDCFGSIKVIIEKPYAAFSHVYAGKYAGLGTVGKSHNLLTPAYGPRVRLVSIFTAGEFEADPMLEEQLCIKCGLCSKCCPTSVLKSLPKAGKQQQDGEGLYEFDAVGCARWAEELTRRRCYPCGVCTKVCPIGQDRELYQEKNMSRLYREEKATLKENMEAEEYRAWTHLRTWGSWAIKDGKLYPEEE